MSICDDKICRGIHYGVCYSLSQVVLLAIAWFAEPHKKWAKALCALTFNLYCIFSKTEHSIGKCTPMAKMLQF